jgi:PhnB protein
VTSLAPWLTVADAARALEFYAAALGALPRYRLDGDDGSVVVAELGVGDATIWISHDPSSSPSESRPVRMIVSVDDPDAAFARAVAAGATVVFEVHEEYGWRSGRVLDPFGHDWEFSRRL